jgi:CubicO group peptidase (beta-lactamase class C family)
MTAFANRSFFWNSDTEAVVLLLKDGKNSMTIQISYCLRRAFAVGLIVGFMISGVLGQSGPSAEEAAKQVDTYLSHWDKKDMPGCAVGVMKDGKLIYKRGVGLANLTYDIPNSPTMLFEVASTTKPFTAMAIALLAEQGKLSIDDDVRKYIPELPQYADTITLRHLLHHTSGLREYEALIFFSGRGNENAHSEKEVLNLIARQKNINFKPGAKYQYSNTGFLLLAAIVKRVSGKSLRAFADENMFKPLGMKSTLFRDDRTEVIKNKAAGYITGPGGRVRLRTSLDDLVGDGGLLTNVEDLSLWVQNYFEPKVGSRETIKMLTTHATTNSGEKINYGFGQFHTVYRGLPVIKHSGNVSGFRAQIARYHDQNFAVIALSNNSAIFPAEIVAKVADIYLAGQFPAAPEKKAPVLPQGEPIAEQDAARYSGIFANTDLGIIFKLSVKDGKLVNSGLLQKEVAVLSTKDKHLLMVADSNGYEMVPTFDKAGQITEVKMLRSNGTSDTFPRMKPPFDSPEQLGEYLGTYHSDELEADYRIVRKGNGFVFQTGPTLEAPLAPAYQDVFTTAEGRVNFAFTRDDKGKITGFVLNAVMDDREVKGVVFTRK